MAIFTPITNGQSIDASTFNNPMGELEDAIESGYRLLASVVAGSATAVIYIVGIPTTARDLYVRMSLAQTGTNRSIRIYFNSDGTAANYNSMSAVIDHASGLVTNQYIGTTTGLTLATATAINQTPTNTLFSDAVLSIPNYSDTARSKVCSFSAASISASGSGLSVLQGVGEYKPTGAITTISIGANGTSFVAGSAFYVFGRGV